MKLFTMKDWQLETSEEIWGLKPFKKLLDRDKTKYKTRAHAELMYVWFFCDIKSDYMLMEEGERDAELKKDLSGLPKNWKADKTIEEAVALYNKTSITTIQRLHRQALKSAQAIGDYLENSAELLRERDKMGKVVNDIAKISQAVQRIPKLMQDLKAAEKEVIKEQQDNAGKKKGAKTFNIFEDGIDVE
jgi:hypothetical protein